VGVEVRAPDGRVWRVRRTLGWPRWRKTKVDVFDGLDFANVGAASDSFNGLVLAIGFAVFLGLFIVLFLPLLLFLAELVLLVPAALLVLRPWRVTASTEGLYAERLEWRVRGWRGSRAAVEEVARELGHGLRAAPENAE
jgi:hypothetical protein